MCADTVSDFRSPQYTESMNIPAPPPPPPSGGPPPPPPPPSNGGAPPPPPVFGGHIPNMRLKTEISDRKEPPAAIQNAMMTKDKKPFTYTPGGIDLSEIRSPRMQKRIVRNQNAPDTHVPQPDVNRPKLALTPGAQAAMQSGAFPVFPAGQAQCLPSHGSHQENGSQHQRNTSSPAPSQSPSQNTLPPPPPQRSSQLLNSPLSEGQPKANLPWLQKAPPQKDLPPWAHNTTDTQHTMPLEQIDGRNTPTLQQEQQQQQQQQQQYNAPSPQNVPAAPQNYNQQRQMRPSPLAAQPNNTSRNQPSPPSRWASAPQKQQNEQQWQQPAQQQQQQQRQWQPQTPQTEAPAQRQWQAPQQTEIPVQREAPRTWQPTTPPANSQQQFNIAPNQNTQQWQSAPPPPQRTHTPQPPQQRVNITQAPQQRSQTPQPQKDTSQAQPGQHVRVIPIQIEGGANAPNRWSPQSPSSPQLNGNGAPIQSKSFKVLQKVTNTDQAEFLEGDSFTIDGIPFSQFGNIQISDQGIVKSQAPNYSYYPQETLENTRNRGGYLTTARHEPNENETQYSRAQTDPRYMGDNIPSRSFRILQAITKNVEDNPVDMKAPFVQVPQVQVRIMTNVPRSAPGTPQPSDNAPPQYMQTSQHQGSTNTSSHSYQVRQAMTATQSSGRPGESEY